MNYVAEVSSHNNLLSKKVGKVFFISMEFTHFLGAEVSPKNDCYGGIWQSGISNL